MPLLTNIGQLAVCPSQGGPSELGLIEAAALAWRREQILWAGSQRELPEEFKAFPSHDAGGALVVPGLVDCHTHLGFGGWRADEFEQRLLGASYLEIARRGGGIASTVAATRAVSKKALLSRCREFLSRIVQLGVTTLECKSGYGLDWPSERKLLQVYRELAAEGPVRIVSTFLGAHIVPPELRADRQRYVGALIENMIPAVARQRLAEFCDVFVEETAFSLEEARRILMAGKRHGLESKLHADQLSEGGGALLAAEVEAVSADHLECISEQGIQALADRRVVAVMLPLAALYLRQTPLQARRLIDQGVRVAVATDFNPGSAPSYHLPLALMLACTLQGMTPAEALRGATIEAARALRRGDRIGSLEAGKAADFVLLDAESVNHWLYHFRPNSCLQTWIGGKQVYQRGVATPRS